MSRRSAETDFLPANTLVLYVSLCPAAPCMASEGWDVIEGAVATEQWTKRESLTLNGKKPKSLDPWRTHVVINIIILAIQ